MTVGLYLVGMVSGAALLTLDTIAVRGSPILLGASLILMTTFTSFLGSPYPTHGARWQSLNQLSLMVLMTASLKFLDVRGIVM